MCVSWCHKTEQLFFNHEDCPPALCRFARGPHPSCDRCCHRQGAVCGLTRTLLPQTGGCCHHNVTVTGGRRTISRLQVVLLGLGANETVGDVLQGFDVPSLETGADQQVDVDQLALPETYGQGADTC